MNPPRTDGRRLLNDVKECALHASNNSADPLPLRNALTVCEMICERIVSVWICMVASHRCGRTRKL
jgi:hypothetical protein